MATFALLNTAQMTWCGLRGKEFSPLPSPAMPPTLEECASVMRLRRNARQRDAQPTVSSNTVTFTDRKFKRLCEPEAASGRETREGQRAGQGPTESGADISEVSERATARVWEAIANAAGGREISDGGTLSGRRWRLPGDTLVELEAWGRLQGKRIIFRSIAAPQSESHHSALHGSAFSQCSPLLGAV